MTREQELEKRLAAIERPEKINPKTLYQRLVNQLFSDWAALWPMVEWVDPETAADRICREVIDLRTKLAAEMRRCDEVGNEFGRKVAELTKELALLKAAFGRAAGHGICGDWFCGMCGYELKMWFLKGAKGELPPLCPLCNHADAARSTGEPASDKGRLSS